MSAVPDWTELHSRFERLGQPIAVVVPVYNHARTVRKVVTEAAATGLPVWVVNDGSTDDTPRELEGLQGVRVLHHTANQGKGAALLTGFRAASKHARWVITFDADGQHTPDDARQLLASLEGTSGPSIVLGCRMGMRGRAVPLSSRFGRAFSNFWVRTSGGPSVSDSQTGFRLYPVPEVIDLPVVARRFQFEVEVLVHAHRAGIPIRQAPVSVVYAPVGGRVSHFRPWHDFWRNAATFARLILARILFMPARQLPSPSVKADVDAS